MTGLATIADALVDYGPRCSPSGWPPRFGEPVRRFLAEATRR